MRCGAKRRGAVRCGAARGRRARMYVGRTERFSKLVAVAKGQVYEGGKCL